MIFVDTSAIIAILAAEPDAATFATKLQAERERICGAHVIAEASMRLATISGVAPTTADGQVTRALRESNIAVVPITEESRTSPSPRSRATTRDAARPG